MVLHLNSTIEVQNGEGAVAGCWGGQGKLIHLQQLTIKDSDGNVLASNTNIRTDTTGIMVLTLHRYLNIYRHRI